MAVNSVRVHSGVAVERGRRAARTGQGPDRCVRVVSIAGVCMYAARAERRVRLGLAMGMALDLAGHGLAVRAQALG